VISRFVSFSNSSSVSIRAIDSITSPCFSISSLYSSDLSIWIRVYVYSSYFSISIRVSECTVCL
jgi:hypothetical protein